MTFNQMPGRVSRSAVAVSLCFGALLLASCDRGGGLTTAEIQESVKERIRTDLGLVKETALFTDTFVGKPLDGDTTVCGTVTGAKEDGTAITPRRFIAATEPARWVKFEPVTNAALASQPDKFVEWANICQAGAEE